MTNIRKLGELIEWVDTRNKGVISTNLLGINIEKFFMPSVANIIGTDLSSYKLVSKNQFACNPMHVGRDEKMPIALYLNEEPSIVSPAYFVFQPKDLTVVNPEYLMLWFRRAEFDRECWFHTDGSVRGGITWDEILDMSVPVPSIEEQNKIVLSYNDIEKRIKLKRQINDNLATTINVIYRNMFSNKEKNGKLSSLIEICYGKDHHKIPEGSIPIIGSGGIMRYGNTALYEGESVLIPRKGTLTNIMYIDEPFWTVDTMFYSKMQVTNVATYVHQYLKSLDFAAMDIGAAVPSMNTEYLYSLDLYIPNENELKQFYSKTKPLYDRIIDNKKACQYLDKVKTILLTKLSSR